MFIIRILIITIIIIIIFSSSGSRSNSSNVNIWKSYIWTADKDVNMKAIFAVTNTTWVVVK